MKVKRESEVAELCPTLGNPMDRSLPGSSVHGIFQARVLEWGAMAFSDTRLRKFFFFKYTPKPLSHKINLLSCGRNNNRTLDFFHNVTGTAP